MPRAWWCAPCMVAFCVWLFQGTMVRHHSLTFPAAWPTHAIPTRDVSVWGAGILTPKLARSWQSPTFDIHMGGSTLNTKCNLRWLSRGIEWHLSSFQKLFFCKKSCAFFPFLPTPHPVFEYQIKLILRIFRAAALHSFHSAIPYHITSPHQHSYLLLMASSFHSIHNSQGSYLWST